MNLAFVPNKAHSKRLKSKIRKVAWIGIRRTRKGKWEWVNKVPQKMPKSFKSAKGQGRCVALGKKLVKIDCSRKLPFVCYGDERLRFLLKKCEGYTSSKAIEVCESEIKCKYDDEYPKDNCKKTKKKKPLVLYGVLLGIILTILVSLGIYMFHREDDKRVIFANKKLEQKI